MSTRSAHRVVILDLLAETPFYDERLATALRGIDKNVRLVAVSPHRSPNFFRSHHLETNQLIVDRVSTLPSSLLQGTKSRRIAKAIEYHLNLALLGARFLFKPPDVVHTQWMPLLGWSPVELWFVRLLRARGIPYVHTVHNVLPHDVDSQRVRRAHSRLYHLTTMLISHTRVGARELEDLFEIDASRIATVPHGPLFGSEQTEASSEAGAWVDRGEDEVMVLSLGGIRPYKGHGFLLRGWSIAAIPNARLVIAGGGDSRYIRELRELSHELDIAESVDIREGYLSDLEVEALHRQASIAVFPYRHINQSGALMTAMAYGCAIVATDIGGFSEVIESGRNGVLVEYGDVGELASILIDLSGNEDLRRDLGRAALADTRTVLSWSNIARKTMEVYSLAIDITEGKSVGLG